MDEQQNSLRLSQIISDEVVRKISKILEEMNKPLSLLEKTRLAQAIKLKSEQIEKVLKSDLPIEAKVEKIKESIYQGGFSIKEYQKETAFKKAVENSLVKKAIKGLKNETEKEVIDNLQDVKTSLKKAPLKFARLGNKSKIKVKNHIQR